MRLAFYGGGDAKDNRALDKQVIALLPKNPQLALIPATSYESHIDFKEYVEQYKKFGISRFVHFPIDIPFSAVMLKEILKSDLIHLGGGNTYYFIHHLRRKKLFPLFREFLNRGGVLTGLSAGAIIMTPDISTASFPHFDCDDNDMEMTNFEAMNLVHFDFFPHYEDKKAYSDEMEVHSLSIPRPLFACPDGSGVIVKDNELNFVGDVWMFEHGEKFKIHSKSSRK